VFWVFVMFVTLVPVGISSGSERASAPQELPPHAVPELRRPREDPLNTVVSALGECANTLPMAARWRLARIINTESAEHGYDPLFITALMQVESGCLATARGNGALGLVQLLPSTARAVARRLGLPWQGERTLTDPSSNIQIGLHYLRELEKMLGDPYRAVAAYNLGPARVLRMSSGRAKQTQYVRKILSLYQRLVQQHA
jgi:soluble lytic murein transglycosylase-like protein